MRQNDYHALVHRLSYVSHLHSYHVINAFRGNQIYRGQPPLLRYLSEHEACSQKELADFMHISPASVAVSIKRMCKAGLVEKTRSGEDERVNRLSITPGGRQIMNKCSEEFDKLDKRMFAGLSEDEIGEFDRILGILERNLADDSVSECEVFKLVKAEKGKDACK